MVDSKGTNELHRPLFHLRITFTNCIQTVRYSRGRRSADSSLTRQIIKSYFRYSAEFLGVTYVRLSRACVRAFVFCHVHVNASAKAHLCYDEDVMFTGVW